MNKLKVFEAFAGMGAWSKALKRLNIPFELVGFSENDPYAVKAYTLIHNEPESKNIGDITKFEGELPNDIDLFAYSPPCQAFSVAGKQLGFEDQRGVLFFDALRLIKQAKPKYCVMENVKGLVQKKFKNEFDEMLKSLEEAGYNNYIPNGKVLNSKLYGTPQNRERVFIVSIRKDIDDNSFLFPEPIPLKKTLADIIESDAELPILHNIYGGFNEDKPRVFNEYSPTIRTSAGDRPLPSICLKNRGKIVEKKDGIVSCLDANYWKGLDNHAARTGVIVKSCSLRTRNYKGQPQQLELRTDDVSNAITSVPKDSMLAIIDDTYKNREERIYDEHSPAIRSGRSGLKVIDGKLIRTLTTLETVRLMDFDDYDWQILKNNKISNSRIYKLCGNSIVVSVIEEIFKKLFNT